MISTVTVSFIKLSNTGVKSWSHRASFLQIYNIFPWLGPFLKTWWDIIKRLETQIENSKRIIAELKESLNPGTCRGLVDAFLTHKNNLEVRHFHSTVTAETQCDLEPFLLSRVFNSDQLSVFRTLTSTISITTITSFISHWTCSQREPTPRRTPWSGAFSLSPSIHIFKVPKHSRFSCSEVARLKPFCTYPIRSGPGRTRQGGGEPSGAGRRQEKPAVRRSRHPWDSETGQHRSHESSSQNQPRHRLPGILHRKGSAPALMSPTLMMPCSPSEVLSAHRARWSSPSSLLSCMMRANGWHRTRSTPPTSWTTRADLSEEMPSCPSPQVGPHPRVVLQGPVGTVAPPPGCRSQDVPGRGLGQDGALPLLRLSSSALPFQTCSWTFRGRPGPHTSCGHHPPPFASWAACHWSLLTQWLATAIIFI